MRPIPTSFPKSRQRRLRQSPWIRDMVRETQLSPSDFIWPLFVCEGEGVTEPIDSMPGVSRHSIDRLIAEVDKAALLGIPCVALFPYTPDALKTPGAEEAWNPENLVNKATRHLKAAIPDIGIMLDVALDPYNSDGHDGIVRDGKILNDETLMALEKQALSHAESGADILGPSDMMDGRVGVIRQMLEMHDFPDKMIMSYAAKFASSFYGPFRDAVGATGALKGDKKTYQLDYGNRAEALREVAQDIDEGADMVMVKPGMPYLDICREVKSTFEVPTFAYQVSGEYAMLCASAERGWIDREAAILESLGAFKRAGCDGILTYFAYEAATLMKEE